MLPHDAIYGFSVGFNVACLCAALVIFASRLRQEFGAGRALAAAALLVLLTLPALQRGQVLANRIPGCLFPKQD